MEQQGAQAKHEAKRQFTRDVKLEAVRAVVEDRAAIERVAQGLAITPTLLRRWLAEFCDASSAAFPGRGNARPDRVELARLQREVEKLRHERDLLIACLRDVPASAYVQAPRRGYASEPERWAARSLG